MIKRLGITEFNNVKSLVEDLEYFPEVHSVVNGMNPGAIYVDSLNNPRSALVWNQGMQGFYLIGDEASDAFNRDIKAYVNEVLVDELKNKGINWVEISGVSEAWEKNIEEMFEDRGIKFGYQLIYRLNGKTDIHMNSTKHEIYDIMRFEEATSKANISNIDFITNEIKQFWGSLDNFYDNGACFFAVENNEAVSICYSGFKANDVETIGIETLSDHGKKGYAYQLAVKYIEDCVARNVSPHWDCSDDNAGSVRLAEKLGFELKDKYKCFWFNF